VSQQYIFGDRAEEQRRLDAQASLLNPATERFFRASGILPAPALSLEAAVIGGPDAPVWGGPAS
jgi:hypothetical protein